MMTRNKWLFAILANLFISSTVVGTSWLLNSKNVNASAIEIARIKGDALFLMIDATRHWNTLHGGLYAPVTEVTQPNIYLPPSERQITDNFGRELTKINPAYMIRQISKLLNPEKVEIRIASIEPLHKYNQADEWESVSIKRFIEGEVNSIVSKSGQNYRYISPMLVKESCIKCHNNQNYQEGNVAGGISLKFTAFEIEKLVGQLDHKTSHNFWLIFISIFISGLLMFIIVGIIYSQLLEIKSNEKELAYKASHDGLTGALNHNSLMEIAEHEFKRSCHHERPLSLLMLDLDYFKKVNDAYGHQVGDQILIAVIEQVNLQIREIDFVGRYGGEEFLILLPDVDEKDALIIAERIRSKIKDIHIGIVGSSDEQKISVGVSIGLAERKSSGSENLESLVKKADEALYRAKASGRDTVVKA